MTHDPTPPYGTPPWGPGSAPRAPGPSGSYPPYEAEPAAQPYPQYEPYVPAPPPEHRHGPDEPGPPPRRGSARRWILLISGVLAAIAAGIAVFLALPRLSHVTAAAPAAPPAPAAVPAATPQAAATSAGPVGGVPLTGTASADCTAPDSVDASGTTVSYPAANVLDGRPDTAWRCDGDGVGHKITLTLNRPARVTQVGIIPGYAKTDAADGTDRYAQNRRLSKVRYVFDDGTAVEQTLDTTTGNRALQFVPVPGVTTKSVTVELLASVPGQRVGSQQPSDRVAVSELQVLGGG